MKLISTSGVISDNLGGNCPAVGTVLSEACGLVTLYDAANTPHTGNYTKIQIIANGSCGTTQNVLTPVDGECNYPPNQWAVSYTPSYITTGAIYWNHPQNPQYGSAATYGISLLISYNTVFYDGSVIGFSYQNGDLIGTITGLDGWQIKFYYQQSQSGAFNYIEDDLTP